MQNIKITLQLKKVKISNFNINIFKEKNVDAIQIFISKVSNFQEEIHYKMRNSLKILEHLDNQLEKESELVIISSCIFSPGRIPVVSCKHSGPIASATSVIL